MHKQVIRRQLVVNNCYSDNKNKFHPIKSIESNKCEELVSKGNTDGSAHQK